MKKRWLDWGASTHGLALQLPQVEAQTLQEKLRIARSENGLGYSYEVTTLLTEAIPAIINSLRQSGFEQVIGFFGEASCPAVFILGLDGIALAIGEAAGIEATVAFATRDGNGLLVVDPPPPAGRGEMLVSGTGILGSISAQVESLISGGKSFRGN